MRERWRCELETQEMRGQRNAAVVGVAVAVAGVLGTAMMALVSRKDRRTTQERMVDRLLEERDHAESQLSSALDYSDQLLDVVQSRASEFGQEAFERIDQAQHDVQDVIENTDTKRVKKALKRVQKQAPKDAKDARKRFGKGAKRAADDAPGFIQYLGDEAVHLGEEAAHRGQDLVDTVLEQAPGLQKQLKQARKEWQPVLEDAADSATEALETGRKRLVKAVEQSDIDVDDLRKRAKSASKQLQDVAEEGRKRAKKEVLPALREAAGDARARLEEGRKYAEKEVIPAIVQASEDGRKRAEKDVLPALRDAADDVRERAESEFLPRVREVGEDVRHRAEEWRDYAEKDLRDDISESTEKLRKQVQRSSGQLPDVGGQVSNAAGVVADGGRNTGAFVAWVGVGAGIVYVAFLNDDQRAKVRHYTNLAISEAREIYRDIQGHDQQFE